MWGCVSVIVRRLAPLGACAALCLLLANCANNNPYGVSASARLVAPGEPIPKGGGVYHVGQPYTVLATLRVEDSVLSASSVMRAKPGKDAWPADR